MFSKTSLSDGFISDIIEEYAIQSGKPFESVLDEVREKVDERIRLLSFSPFMYQNMIDAAVEAVVFDEYMPVKKERLFSENVFYALKNMIIEENSSFFPLKDGYSKRKVLKTNWFVVPASDAVRLPKRMQSCETAMVTNKGDFVFNRFFCESLCRYAKYKGISARGPKYASNGGPIPDYYEYVEFLIMHEFMHIIHGDVFYINKFKNISKDIQNIVGDFIINYKLLKSGYNQPPIGLYSENINYDKQDTIEEMREVVVSELLKMPDGDVSKHPYASSLDEHVPEDFSESERLESSENLDSAVDENQKSTEGLSQEDKENPLSSEKTATEDNAKRESQKRRQGTGFVEDNEEYVPQYRWAQLVKRLLPTNSPREEYSYSKISKKTVSCLKQLRESGVSSAKPGVLLTENEKKGIFFIIDSSGSVLKELEGVKEELLSMVRGRLSRLLDVYILKFDSRHKLFQVNLKRNSYKEIGGSSFSVQNSVEVHYKGVENIFAEGGWGGSTNLSREVIERALGMWAAGYNIVLFSDTDIIHDKENYENLQELAKTTSKRRNSFAIITTREAYKNYKIMGMNNVLLSSFQ